MAAIGGLDPSVLVSPDYQVQMQKAERARALAQALRAQSMQDTPGNGGSVSWSQGLARLADALAANISNKRADKTQLGANQAYAKGMARMFGLPQGGSAQPPQMPQGAPPSPGGPPMPPQAPQAPPPPPFVPGQAPAPGQADPLAPQPDAPPQAAPPQPAAAPTPPQGGAPSQGPMNLTGDPRRDMGLYVMNPEEYGKALIGNAAKGTAPNDMEVTLSHAQAAMTRGDIPTATALLQSIQKSNYIPPTTGRPGGWTIYPDGHKEFNPQAPIPGAVPGKPDAQGNMTWSVPAGVEDAVRERAQSQSGGESAGKAPFQFQQVFNQETGQMEYRPVSEMAGSGSLNAHYGRGGPQGGAPAQAPGHFAAGPSLGQSAAADAYGKGNAQAFLDTQSIAKESPQRVQALREMQSLVANGLPTGATAAKLQQLGEEHGLTFLTKDNAFVFNKDAARFVAQSASDLGLNGSDARLGMMANASPNMKMPPAALKVVVPTMIGLEYAKMAKATAASAWAQRDPGGNAKFETTWRQSYDPRMFTAYAQGGAQALAHAPANIRQQWLKDYRNLKGMGVDFTQFAQ